VAGFARSCNRYANLVELVLVVDAAFPDVSGRAERGAVVNTVGELAAVGKIRGIAYTELEAGEGGV
jgi:hypothetical protein